MKKTINVGIIGQGRSGYDIHAAYLKTDPRFKVIAVADFMAERREFAKAELHCEAYADHADLLKRKDLDLVVNASFSHQHVPITLEALRAGHNVLCEKPLAKRLADINRLEAAQKRSGTLLAIFQQARYAPYFQCIQRVIRSRVLGRIIQISIRFNGFGRRWDWQTLKEFNGGSLMNTGPHPLDQALTLFGEGQPKVNCFMDRTREGNFGDAENHVKLLLSAEDKPLIDLEISSCCPYPFFTYNIYGTRGGLYATNKEAEWKYFKPSEAPRQKLMRKPLQKENGRPAYATEQLPMHTERWSADDATSGKQAAYSAASAAQDSLTASYYHALYLSLTKGKKLDITLDQIRRQVAVIAEAQRQNRHIYA